MPVAFAVMVGPGDLRVRKGSGLLTCVGLRSGACLCIYDPVNRVGGMAYMTDADPGLGLGVTRPGRYATLAVKALIDAIERTGAVHNRLVASITGGAESDDPNADMGVAKAVQIELVREGIHLMQTDLGGSEDRATILDIASGAVRVKTESQGTRTLCRLQGSPTLSALRQLAEAA